MSRLCRPWDYVPRVENAFLRSCVPILQGRHFPSGSEPQPRDMYGRNRLRLDALSYDQSQDLLQT